jgi:hypothetical protein
MLYCTTTGVKCCVVAGKICPVLFFNVDIYFWTFGIIDVFSIKCGKIEYTSSRC